MDAVDHEEAAIWREYLAQIRGLAPDKYDQVEPWAWANLRRQLKNYRQRMKRRVA